MTQSKGVPARPAQLGAWGKEEQGSGRSFRRKAETEASGLCDDAGHAENPYNNRCDELAVMESRKYKG